MADLHSAVKINNSMNYTLNETLKTLNETLKLQGVFLNCYSLTKAVWFR